jgi:twinkle protein
VVHPRKEDETSKLSISSFYGSAKATQEADTVIILQSDSNRRKYIDVRKNRFDGTLGTSPLYFQSKSGRYEQEEGGQNFQSQLENKSKLRDKLDQDLDNHWQFAPSSDIRTSH